MELVDIDTRLIFAILNGKVSAAINRKLAHNFYNAGFDLIPEEWTILLYLSEKDGVMQNELCEAIFTDKPGMTRLLNRMESKHLVLRKNYEADHRVNLIFLTEQGRQTKLRAQHIALRTLKEALRGLDLRDIQISQEVLRGVFNNMANDFNIQKKY